MAAFHSIIYGRFWVITEGMYADLSEIGGTMRNSVILHFPQIQSSEPDLSREERVLTAAARVWEPDWAGIMSQAAQDEREYSVTKPFVDWMVFVRQQVSSLSLPTFSRSLQNLGTIIVVQPEPPSSKDPEAIRRIKDVEAAIGV